MSRIAKASRDASDRQALRRRVRQMYDWFNQGEWSKCFSVVDPNLRTRGRIQQSTHEESLARFKDVYGKIEPWHVRISTHLDASSNKQDNRPFAYVYLVWKDQAHGFHMFRERWVQDSGRWYTRVVGLVPNATEATPTAG